MKTTVWMTLLASAVLALGIAACGDDEEDGGTDAAGGSGGETAANGGSGAGENTTTDHACIACVKDKCAAKITACTGECKTAWDCIVGKYAAATVVDEFDTNIDACLDGDFPLNFGELAACATNEGEATGALCADKCPIKGE